MTERRNPDPLNELRRANPADIDQLSSASLARVRARVQEVTMTDRANVRRSHGWRSPARLALGGTLATMLVVALVVLRTPDQPGVRPGVSPGPSTIAGVGLCVEFYGLETLGHRSFAFDGTVAAIEGGTATFTVHAAYRGVSPGEAQFTLSGMSDGAITPVGGPDLQVGRRYLVAGDQGIVWGCGFTQDYDAGTAAAWAEALRD